MGLKILPYDLRIAVFTFVVVLGCLMYMEPSNIPYLTPILPFLVAWETFKYTRSIFTYMSTTIIAISQFSVYYYLYYFKNNSLKISVNESGGMLVLAVFSIAVLISLVF